LEKVLGVSIGMERVRQVLTSLGFRLESEGVEAVRAYVPYWRSDITIADDLVEEVARIIGYDNLPTGMLSTRVPHYMPQELTEFRERVRDLLASCGLQEVITYSLTSRDSLLKAGVPNDGAAPLRVSNPMSADLEYMRTSLRPSLLRMVAANIRRQEGPVRLFEVGRIYMPRENDLPDERETVVLAIAGARSPVSWTTPRQEVDFFDAKGVVEAVVRELGIDAGYDSASVSGYHPGKTASIKVGDAVVGMVGEVHPTVREAFDLEDVPVAMAEVDLAALHGALARGREAYVALPKFPPAVRDLSILVSSDVPAATIQQAVLGHTLVARVTLFDVYEGDRLPAGQRSLAFHVHFQDANRTLTADDVLTAMERIVSTLRKQFDATLRK
jgi:phenylalanyl-tRNA synthetase beta chain